MSELAVDPTGTPVKVDLRNTEGGVERILTLDEKVFGIEPNVAVLHQVVTAQLAAARAGTQSTKTRAEVRGGGRKPFKQKGTGRARQGSDRAPQFTGGGIALGPKPRSYRQRTPRKMIALALRSALSDRAAAGRVAVVEAWPWTTPTTRGAREALDALGLDGRILLVLARDDESAYKSFRNLPAVQVILAGELNAYDVLCNDWIVFTAATLPGHVEQSEPVVAPTPQPASTTAEKAPTAKKAAAVEDATPVEGSAPEPTPAEGAAEEQVDPDALSPEGSEDAE